MSECKFSEEKRNYKRRAAGGNSWADSIRNISIGTCDYISIWTERASEKQNSKVEPFFTKNGFVIVSNGKIIAKESYEFVEKLRCERYNAFCDWLDNLIRIDLMMI